MRLESGEVIMLLYQCAKLVFGSGWQRRLGSGAGGENGDGGRDNDSLHFFVAITIPQIPLSEINGVVNQFPRRGQKRERSNFQVCVGGTAGHEDFIFA